MWGLRVYGTAENTYKICTKTLIYQLTVFTHVCNPCPCPSQYLLKYIGFLQKEDLVYSISAAFLQHVIEEIYVKYILSEASLGLGKVCIRF